MPKTDATLLIVDDNADALGLMNQTLDQAGYTVLVANSGSQAIEILDKVSPNLMLLDAIMPEMDGFETCRLIKQSHPDLPVIFMTGLSETEHMVAGFEAGGVDYLVKPVNHQELLARVKVHINNAQVTQETKQALDDSGQYLMSLDSEGHILWRTEQAQAIVKTLTSKERILVNDWIKDTDRNPQLMLQQSPITLTLTLVEQQAENSYLVKFKAQDLKFEKQTLKNKLKITRREAEVLFWVAQGKTDWEISQILSISDRTVNKHLEQIYRKLGVSNRTAASSQALSVLS
ncbi:DNA-binding response regulator [Marinicella rhabdoformis]|uniref:response regulator transcription factor n=1 Tax=Marinicella rhabdoformis TaxID=2580566 RepID=UPI0012AEDF20|nr:DNA-binding response regulator [Marinicella rhabdoformis]